MAEDQYGRWELKTKLPVSFTIKIVDGLFQIENKTLLDYGSSGRGCRRLIIIDLKVSELYLNYIINYFKYHEVDYHLVTIDATEDNKDTENLFYILEEAEKFGLLRRDEPIIAIGGGVLLDIVGLAANLYRRGVPYIKVPTTLLALVDASVGVKTGINFKDRRNRLGSYYPPVAAYLDKSFLKSLSLLEISSGLGEILKMAVVKDKKLFNILENHGKELYESKMFNCEYTDDVINLAVKGMKNELQENLWELDLQRYVDFGHSFSPVIEMRSISDSSVSSLTHGQAVALDVIFSSVISFMRNMLSKNDVMKIIKTSRNMNLPISHPYFLNPSLLLESLNETIKHRNGDQNLPIPKKIGESIFINDLTFEEIKTAAKLMDDLTN